MKKAIPVIICCLLLVVAAFGLFEYTKTLSQINRTMGYQLRAIDDAVELIRRMGADVIQSDFTSGDGKPYNFILDKKKIKDVLKGLNDACREYNEKW